jgi:hypothetical protein
VFPVGRLDYQSEGLILLTNDGELAERVSHPKHGLVREYLVKVRGDLDDGQLRKLMAGSVIEGRRVRPRSAHRQSASRGGTNSWWPSVTDTNPRSAAVLQVGHHAAAAPHRGGREDDRLRPRFSALTDDECRRSCRPARATAAATRRPPNRSAPAESDRSRRCGRAQDLPRSAPEAARDGILTS